MKNFYEELEKALAEMIQIKNLVERGLAKGEEKRRFFELCDFYSPKLDSMFDRKAEKIKVSRGRWTRIIPGNFIPEDEANQLNPWIELFQEFLKTKKKRSTGETDSVSIELVSDKDAHIFLFEKETGEHVHAVVGGKTGEIRFDAKDKYPGNIIESIKAEIKLKNGEEIKIITHNIEFPSKENKD